MATITVDTGTSYQTIRAWEVTAEAGHQFNLPADTPAYPSSTFANYKDGLLAAALDVGINAIRIEWRMDDINATGYTIDSPFPSAIQPSTATSGQKHYDRPRNAWDAFVSDYADLLTAQGESLWITFCVVDFRNGGYHAEDTPSEYSSAIVGAVTDFHTYTGLWPDAIEPLLEPDNSSGNSNWDATKLANNIVQANTDLISAGMPSSVKWLAPSVTSAANGTTWIANMKSANGSVTALISTYPYHRYGGSNTDVGNIQSVANSDSKETGMTEWIGATHLTLYDDLTIGHASIWQQYTLAFPWSGATDDGSAYFEVNTSTWAVSPYQRTKYLKHYFHAIRRDAVRKGASISGTGSGNGAPLAFCNTNGTYVVTVKCTGAVDFDIAGLPNGTYEVRYTTGDGINAPSAYWQSLSDQVVSGGNTGTISMPGAGVVTIYDQTFLDSNMSNYYADPSITSGGTGTIGDPWPLATALANGSQTSGDTLWLRDGTYTGKFTSTLAGGTVRSYTGEWAVIDGYDFTTLAGAINSSVTTFDVASTAGMYGGLVLVIDNEDIQISPVDANTVTAVRGWNGTTAVAHSDGATAAFGGNQFYVTGDNTIYRDFEIMHSLADRVDTGIINQSAIFNIGNGNSFINLILHDNGLGLFSGSSSDNTLVYGCLIYNNGGIQSGGSYGLSLYLENASGYSRAYETICLNSFGLNMQGFGQTGPYVGGHIDGSIFAGGGAPAGEANYNMVYGPNSQESPTGIVNECHFYRNGTVGYHMNFGYAAGVDVGTVTDNYFGGGETAMQVGTIGTSLTLDGNIVHDALVNTLAGENGYAWNNNTYYNTASGNQKFGNTTALANQTFATWKTDTGFDAASTINSGDLPDTVIVRPNSYEIGRAHIIIYAASAPSSINVNLATTGLTDGQAYTIRNAFDYFDTAVATGTYDAGSTTISVPLTTAATNVAAPIGVGGSVLTPSTTAPNFVVLVVIPGAAGASTPGTPTGLTANVGQSSGATGTMLLAWTLGAGTETSVTVRRIVGGVTTDIPLAADITSYTDTGQTVGLPYTYAVKASNASGDSAWSDTAQEVLTGLTCFGAPPSIG